MKKQLAAGMVRGKTGIHLFEVPMPEIKQPDEVLIRVKEVGLDGTDFNAIRFNLQDIGEGRDEMVMGHEAVGVVEATGPGVKSFKPGDPVTITVRRGCDICHPCLHNMSDMCMTGLYRERGLHRLDGSLTRFVIEREQYVIKVPAEVVKWAVFSEPLSIVEKGVEQIRIIQSRLPWTCDHPEHTFLSPRWGGCKTALVVGAGPLGLLAIALLTISDIKVFVADILPEDHPRVRLAKGMDATYIDARSISPKEIVADCCLNANLDIIFEASGAAATAVGLIPHMSRSSIYVMTGIPREELMIQIDAARLVRQIVRFNQVIVGSINSNRTHFERALQDLKQITSRFSSLPVAPVIHRWKLEDSERAFATQDPAHIKTVIEVEPW
ncbi:MAG: alcohol dehydrogenase catalytic domain-containing protein [Chloroflexi bacterium]|nr:alcohol dehydrogenase catalytic domain-containing protein [Chloroflexota bacterium]